MPSVCWHITYYFVMRLNAGVPPSMLSDAHLRAERRELAIPFGTIRKQLLSNSTYFPKAVPEEFCLNTGHINFFIPKLLYVIRRLIVVNEECANRGFESSMSVDLTGIPERFLHDWHATMKDSQIVRDRIADRLKNPLKATSNYHKYYSRTIGSIDEFCNKLKNAELSV